MQTNIKIVDTTIHENLGVEIDREIGRGKYGIVYNGVRVDTGKDCAVKVISLPNPELEEKLRDIYGDDENAIENLSREMASRFENEIKSMSRLGNLNILGSQNIVKMYNHMLVQSGIYSHIIILMELALPLKRFLSHEDFLLKKVMQIAYETAYGLKACHTEGIIHRDIKEDNLFIGADGKIKIGDFGVANIDSGGLSKKTEGVGTPHYIAPEIKNNESYDETVDIYSLGIVLYMLLNENKPPFYSSEVDERTAYNMRMMGKQLPPPKYATNKIANIVLKCCQFNPNNRYRNIDMLIKDLEDAENEMSAEELDTIIPYPKRSFKDDEWWEEKFDNNQTMTIHHIEIPQKNILRDTVGAFKDLLQKFGNNTKESQFIEGVYTGRGIAERDMNEEERKVKYMKRLLIILLCVLVVLGTTLVFLYPKTATFYPNESDDYKLYAKYLFLPARKLTDNSASYVNLDGNEVFFSDRKDGKKLYKVNIWTGKETALCDKECHYDVVIGDYIYFTDNSPTGDLYRINKNGEGLQCLIKENCGELKNKNGSLEVWLANLSRFEEIDVNSISKK